MILTCPTTPTPSSRRCWKKRQFKARTDLTQTDRQLQRHPRPKEEVNRRKAVDRRAAKTRVRAAVPKVENPRPRPPPLSPMIPMQRDTTPTIRIIARFVNKVGKSSFATPVH